MRSKVRTPGQAVARIAADQHGVITIGQLLATGLSRDAVGRRVRKGSLHRVHRGVYRVGHRAPSVEASYLAAVLACGEGAVISGMAAAYLLGLSRQPPPPPEVTALCERRVPGVATRRIGLEPREVAVHRGIPVTTVPRTLVDLAAALSVSDLARACHEAEVRYRVGATEVDACLSRRPQMPGVAKVRAVYGREHRLTLSALERRFVALLRSRGLPLPETNVPSAGGYLDCRWPERRLTVELDGFRYHHTRHAWERDRRRERDARARGDEFRRYTHGDVVEDPAHMLRELRTLLQ
jgi:predicted transcriptional regulator of viral defense system